MILTSRRGRNQRGGLGLLVALSMLLFGHTCAQNSMACGTPAGTYGDAHCEDTTDHDGHCGDSDGCEQHGDPDGCSQSSICCSTWAPPPGTLSVPPPVVAVPLSAALLPAFALNEALASGPLPVPTESPPLRVSFLRL